MRQTIFNNLKNMSGWRTNRKLVVFSVDDYGNVRLASKLAFDNLQKAKIPFDSHFDRLDTLETRDDLTCLFEVLDSVRDKHGNPAIFTPYALSCNINFEAMKDNDYKEYVYESLPNTYKKLEARDPEAYEGTWNLWQEGIRNGFMKPQFHGREHFNLNIFNDLLDKGSQNLRMVLDQNSYISIPEHKEYTNGWTGSYSFYDKKETETFLENVDEGLKMFQEVYGYNSKVFTPPAQQFPLHLEQELSVLGVKYIDRPRRLKRHLGNGQYQMEKHTLGDGDNMKVIVRNVVFEPTTARISNWVDFSFKQIEAAFFWKKPANISTHRVNFCGHIDKENRNVGLAALKQLLDKIVTRWPDVEFISADQLGDIISKER